MRSLLEGGESPSRFAVETTKGGGDELGSCCSLFLRGLKSESGSWCPFNLPLGGIDKSKLMGPVSVGLSLLEASTLETMNPFIGERSSTALSHWFLQSP